jgi:hypothetical protein
MSSASRVSENMSSRRKVSSSYTSTGNTSSRDSLEPSSSSVKGGMGPNGFRDLLHFVCNDDDPEVDGNNEIDDETVDDDDVDGVESEDDDAEDDDVDEDDADNSTDDVEVDADKDDEVDEDDDDDDDSVGDNDVDFSINGEAVRTDVSKGVVVIFLSFSSWLESSSISSTVTCPLLIGHLAHDDLLRDDDMTGSNLDLDLDLDRRRSPCWLPHDIGIQGQIQEHWGQKVRLGIQEALI